MSIFSFFKKVNAQVIDAVAALVPAPMQAEMGAVAHTFAAAFAYDAKQLGAEAKQLASDDVLAAWTAIKTTAASATADPALQKDLFAGNVSAIVTDLSTGGGQVSGARVEGHRQEHADHVLFVGADDGESWRGSGTGGCLRKPYVAAGEFTGGFVAGLWNGVRSH